MVRYPCDDLAHGMPKRKTAFRFCLWKVLVLDDSEHIAGSGASISGPYQRIISSLWLSKHRVGLRALKPARARLVGVMPAKGLCETVIPDRLLRSCEPGMQGQPLNRAKFRS